MTKEFAAWKLYVKKLIRDHPGKSLKWLLKNYHKNHKGEYDEFKKQYKMRI